MDLITLVTSHLYLSLKHHCTKRERSLQYRATTLSGWGAPKEDRSPENFHPLACLRWGDALSFWRWVLARLGRKVIKLINILHIKQIWRTLRN